MHRPLAFGGSDLDRAAHLRREAPAATQILPVWRGQVPMRDGQLAWLAPADPGLEEGAPLMFLGIGAGIPLHACDVSGLDAPPPLPTGAAFTDLRDVMTHLTPLEAEVAATAKALAHWHRSHRFCATCGHLSNMAEAGWQRLCPACAASHFPRTDPVVIMLILHGERLLLGRSHAWRVGMHSCLAGFIEPGETIEAAVRREAFEEAGIRIGTVHYLTSQPWPFPASLMLGCVAQAISTDITLDPVELEAARWADKAEVMEALMGRHPDLSLPTEGSIARHLITRWLADGLE